MSSTHFFYEPFYLTSELERVMDDARSFPTSQIARTSGNKSLKPRYDIHYPSLFCFWLNMRVYYRMDLKENAETNTVSASFEFAGLQKQDVQIDVHSGLLTVSGETKGPSDTEEHGYAVRERRYGKFSRTVKLPQGINVSISFYPTSVFESNLLNWNRRTRSKRQWSMGCWQSHSPSQLPVLHPKGSRSLKMVSMAIMTDVLVCTWYVVRDNSNVFRWHECVMKAKACWRSLTR